MVKPQSSKTQLSVTAATSQMALGRTMTVPSGFGKDNDSPQRAAEAGVAARMMMQGGARRENW